MAQRRAVHLAHRGRPRPRPAHGGRPDRPHPLQRPGLLLAGRGRSRSRCRTARSLTGPVVERERRSRAAPAQYRHQGQGRQPRSLWRRLRVGRRGAASSTRDDPPDVAVIERTEWGLLDRHHRGGDARASGWSPPGPGRAGRAASRRLPEADTLRGARSAASRRGDIGAINHAQEQIRLRPARARAGGRHQRPRRSRPCGARLAALQERYQAQEARAWPSCAGRQTAAASS